MGQQEDLLQKVVAGDIALAQHPGEKMKRWRLLCDVSQKELANELHITASVISDYESGRRKKPGTDIIRKIVQSLVALDEKKESSFLKEFGDVLVKKSGQQIQQITIAPNSLSVVLERMNGKLLTGQPQEEIRGVVLADENIRSLLLMFCLVDVKFVVVVVPSKISLSDVDKRVARIVSLPIISIDTQTTEEFKSKIESVFEKK